MTIIEQERKERLEEILRQIDFLLENSMHDDPDLLRARWAINEAIEYVDSEASNGQS